MCIPAVNEVALATGGARIAFLFVRVDWEDLHKAPVLDLQAHVPADQPYEVKLRTDGIIVEHLKKLRFADLDETTLIEYKDGQYKQSNVLKLLVPDEKSGPSFRQGRVVGNPEVIRLGPD